MAAAYHPVSPQSTLLPSKLYNPVLRCDSATKMQEPEIWIRKHVAVVLGSAPTNDGKYVITVPARKLIGIVS